MNLTAKTRFGLKTILDIAFHHTDGPVQRRQIAQRQGIPTDYMDQILLKLRNAGLIQSLRGREGGYHLSKNPELITLWDVLVAVEDEHAMSDSEKHQDTENYATECLTDLAWDAVTTAMKRQLKKSSLAQLLEQAEEKMEETGMSPVQNYTKSRSQDDDNTGSSSYG
jgi:Rrf2 family protein